MRSQESLIAATFIGLMGLIGLSASSGFGQTYTSPDVRASATSGDFQAFAQAQKAGSKKTTSTKGKAKSKSGREACVELPQYMRLQGGRPCSAARGSDAGE